MLRQQLWFPYPSPGLERRPLVPLRQTEIIQSHNKTEALFTSLTYKTYDVVVKSDHTQIIAKWPRKIIEHSFLLGPGTSQ